MSKVYESTSEAAAAIGVSRQTISDWLKSRRLKGERVPRAGRAGWRIYHDDLIAASQGTMFEQPQAAQLSLDSATQPDLNALSLQVVWPEEERAELFSPDILTGYDTLRAVTYSVSIPMILRLLMNDLYQDLEVIFGDERLAKAATADRIFAWQRSLEEHLTKGFVGMGGLDDPKAKIIMDRQSAGTARFFAMSGSVVHSKIYLLENRAHRRVLVGSANLSTRAMSGRQGEVLVCYDDNEFMWSTMARIYAALRAQATTPVRVEPEIKPAHLVAVEDLPISRQTQESLPVTVYVEAPSDMPGDPDVLAVREEEIIRVFGLPFRDHLKPTPRGEVTVTPAILRSVRRTVSATRPVDIDLAHNLTRALNGRLIYNAKPIERPDDVDGIETDAYLITRYLNNYREFGKGADVLQRNYFAVMSWMYFTPFMSWLRRERSKLGPGNFDCKPTALIYGPSNCGKTDLVTFLFESMFGPPKDLRDKDFTPTQVLERQKTAGLYPLFYDDIRSQRFTSSGRRGSDTLGEAIIKSYDRLHHELSEVPCLVASLNSDAREFSNEVRKRALLVFTSPPLPSDNTELGQRMEREVKELHNRIDTRLYSEYLFRMQDRMEAVTEWGTFDYLAESSGLLVTMFRETLRNEETLAL